MYYIILLLPLFFSCKEYELEIDGKIEHDVTIKIIRDPVDTGDTGLRQT